MQEIIKEVKIIKRINVSNKTISYELSTQNVDPDELMGILTRLEAGLKNESIKPNQPINTKQNYIG
jgi:hypothetical protein